MDTAQIIGIGVGLGTLVVLLLLVFLKTHIVICQPNELLILSGRRHKQPDGSVVGYRVLRGGRGFRWPFLESVSRLLLTTRTIEVKPSKALCAGMIPVDIEGRANVKLAGRPEEGLENAVERFLGKGVEAMERTARQVLEGALRGVVATVSPEEANAKRLELAQQVSEQARPALRQLGIVLDYFQIQGLTDQEGYLEAIGRKRNAEVRRDAQVAEAEADAEARSVSASQRRVGREAELAADMVIVERENALAVERAQLLANQNRAEQAAEVAGQIARAEAEIDLEAKRAELSVKREEADTIVPARARREALVLESEGRASRIIEDGKATAEAIEVMREQWDNGKTHDLFLIKLLPELLDKVTRVVAENLRVDKLTILDGGDGNGLPTHVQNLTKSAVVMLEQLKNATGVDLAQIAKRAEKSGSTALPKELD